MHPSALIPAEYDYRLVALSVLIAICASYTALTLAGRVAAARSQAQLKWVLGGAVAMGTGIWSMHYTGMLAYRLPIAVYYHIPTVLLSLGAAIFASFIALLVVSRPELDGLHLALGSLMMGAAICAMHYTGMAAMRLSAMHNWDVVLVLASVGIAVAVSLAALVLTYVFRDGKKGIPLTLACAIVMGAAVPAMHYTAMAAVSYTHMDGVPDLTNAVNISTLANSAIIVMTFVILGSVFLLGSRSAVSSRKTQTSEAQETQTA